MPLAIFDLDGTLIDSDAALLDAFVALGIEPETVTFGHVLEHECERLGLSVEAYLEAYDVTAAPPYPGADELLAKLERWAVCSNKDRRSGQAELERLGWRPEVALFADTFAGPKVLGPVLDRLGITPEDAIYVGDTEHDRTCASTSGVRFALAGWNPRARTIARSTDLVLHEPIDVLDLL